MHLHLDLVSGLAGDMTVAALIDCGVPLDYIQQQLQALPVEGYTLGTRRVDCGHAITGLKFDVTLDGESAEQDHDHQHTHEADQAHSHDHQADPAHDHSHDHEGDHDHSPERSWRHIRQMLQSSPLAAPVVERAVAIFEAIALAEGRVHGVAPEDVHFHEVGAVDSIVDVVAVALALDYLGVDTVSASPVPLGRGRTRSQHGHIPVPAPATLLMLEGALVEGTGLSAELVTPTGAGVLAALVDSWGQVPDMRLARVGHGAGTRKLPDRPNLVRALLGTRRGDRDAQGLQISKDLVLSANIDDMSGELCAHLAATLFELGALDVWWTPIIMKKGRPAQELSALSPPGLRATLVEAILRESTTLGVRTTTVLRHKLDRMTFDIHVEALQAEVTVKVATLDGRITNVAPEFESARAVALQLGIPLKVVLQKTTAAATARFVPGDPSDGRPT